MACYAGLVHARDDLVRHELAVLPSAYLLMETHLVPVLAVLVATGLVVPPLSVDEEYGKVRDVEVCDGGREARGEAPCPAESLAFPLYKHLRHEPITEVVWVPGSSPPSAREELCTALCLHERKVFRVFTVPKVCLFIVRRAENVQSEELECGDCYRGGYAEIDWVEGQETRLERVCEWDPGEVAKGEHEAESVCSDIHLTKDSRFRDHAVDNVPPFKGQYEPHGIGHSSQTDVLLARTGNVENHPADKSRADLVECLNVERGESGKDRVERATDEELESAEDGGETHVVDEITRVAAECEQFAGEETPGIDPDTLSDRHDKACSEEWDPVVVDPGKRLDARSARLRKHASGNAESE